MHSHQPHMHMCFCKTFRKQPAVNALPSSCFPSAQVNSFDSADLMDLLGGYDSGQEDSDEPEVQVPAQTLAAGALDSAG